MLSVDDAGCFGRWFHNLGVGVGVCVHGADGDGEEGLGLERAVLPDGADGGGHAHRVGILYKRRRGSLQLPV